MDPNRRLFLSLALEVVFAMALLALWCKETDCPRVGTGEPASIRLRRATPQLSFGVAASGGLAINYPLTMNRRSLDRWDEWARVELKPIPQARAPFLIVALESPEPCVGATGSQRTSRLLAGSAALASCSLSTDVG